MCPDSDSRDGQAHGLGPQVVGARVVVRRRLPGETGPSGGPALTDLLGVCLAWADGACVIQPESGPPVTIALADIVSGKPVPPRPSPRPRVSPAAAQRRAMAMWPDLRAEPLGEWVLRSSASASARRANSVLAFGDPGTDDPVGAVTSWYAAQGRRPIAAALSGSPEAEVFLGAGWGPESGEADTRFLLAGVASVARAAGPPAVEVTLETHPVAGQAVARVGDAASGLGSYADGWVGIGSLAVAPEHRRRGLARAVVAALAGWGAEQGAETVYLQVLGDNVPALGLYERLGFAEHHAYRYLAAP